MGAEFFETKSNGKSVEEAFKKAVDQALYDHGHSGYTGTIAEKDEFQTIPGYYSEEVSEEELEALLEDRNLGDKWGPCAAIKIHGVPDTWLFFGWASS